MKRRQNIDSTSAGKFALAAIAKASPTMYATFWPLKAMPSTIDTSAEHDRRDPRDAQLFLSAPLARAGTTLTHRVVRQRRRAGQREAGDDREDRREGDGRDEAEKRLPADDLRQQRRRHVAARVDRA